VRLELLDGDQCREGVAIVLADGQNSHIANVSAEFGLDLEDGFA